MGDVDDLGCHERCRRAQAPELYDDETAGSSFAFQHPADHDEQSARRNVKTAHGQKSAQDFRARLVKQGCLFGSHSTDDGFDPGAVQRIGASGEIEFT